MSTPISPMMARAAPPAADLDISLVHVPAFTDSTPARPSRLGQQRSEPLNPSEYRHVVHRDAAFGEKLLDVAIRESEPQVPSHGQHDHLRWELEPTSAEHDGAERQTRRASLGVVPGQPWSDVALGR
jgi:hypothetical protein